ncbi:hypothetical protein C7K08_11820 [Synechococcus lacustris str. Tous]|uniref:Uncharacterized protein n=1 Tax=Synechococcus lacustris str. Tous TaxID=1910958 RepID=A0A2P7EBV3_9SYNE|nr:hypothetical protein C7K08_11820 [Synechococcus lacustris str. Tous]
MSDEIISWQVYPNQIKLFLVTQLRVSFSNSYCNRVIALLQRNEFKFHAKLFKIHPFCNPRPTAYPSTITVAP